MRLMLGIDDSDPSLLVDITQEYSPTHFDFWVVNGAWDGTYQNGYITIWHPWNPWTSLENTSILTDNQDRLRGSYQTVFDNFQDADYIAPLPKKISLPAGWDDDIPF